MYRVVVSRSANKELQELPTQVVNRIVPQIMKLGENPRPPGCKKLKGEKESWRIRVGDYRVVYSIEDEVRVVDVRKIGHRKDIYE
jgi:mRNA interferase RelE/StbE